MHTGNRSYKLNPSQMLCGEENITDNLWVDIQKEVSFHLSVTTLSSGYFERIPFTSVGGDLPSLWARSHRSILLISAATNQYETKPSD